MTFTTVTCLLSAFETEFLSNVNLTVDLTACSCYFLSIFGLIFQDGSPSFQYLI